MASRPPRCYRPAATGTGRTDGGELSRTAGRAARGGPAGRDFAAGRYPPYRGAGRPVGQGALVHRRGGLRHARGLGRDQPPRPARRRHGVFLRRDRGQGPRRARPPGRAALGQCRARPRDPAGGRRGRPLPPADPAVLGARRRADDHRRRDARPRPGRRARAQCRGLPLSRQGESADRHRHRHPQQFAALRRKGIRAQPAAADLDQYRHPPDRGHRRHLQGPHRDERGRHRRRHAGRRPRAYPVQDGRHRVHRRCRDRAGGGDPADRLDPAGGTVRRVHPADGRAPLEPAGARERGGDAQRCGLLRAAHAVGEYLAVGADLRGRRAPGVPRGRCPGHGREHHPRRVLPLARGDRHPAAPGRRARTRLPPRSRSPT